MTTSALDILVRARDEASSTLRTVGSETSKLGTTTTRSTTTMSKGFDSAKSHMSSLLKFGAGAVGIVGVEQFASRALDAFDGLEKSTSRLDIALGKIGTGTDSAGIVSWAKTFSLQTGIAEGDVVDVTSKLATFGQAFLKNAGPNAQAQLEKLSGGFENMAAATGKSVSMLMRSLGPAILNTPTTAVTLLQKFGALSTTAANQVKALGATSDTALQAMVDAGTVTQEWADHVTSLTAEQRKQAASQMEINALQSAYAGEAAKTATPLERLRNLWNQVELAAGKFISEGLGWLLNTGFPALKQAVMTVWHAFQPFFAVIAKAAAQIFPALQQAWQEMKPSLVQLWKAALPFLKVLGAVIGLALLGALKVLPILIKAIGALIAVVLDLASFLAKVLVGAFKVVWKVAGPIWKLISHAIVGAYHAVQSVWRGLTGFFKAIWNGVKAIITGVINWIADKIKWIWDKVMAVYHAVQKIPGVGAITGGGGGIGGAITGGLHLLSSIPGLASGGLVERTGLAIVHEGEQFSGVGRRFGTGTVQVNIDRRKFVDESDFDIRYRGW